MKIGNNRYVHTMINNRPSQNKKKKARLQKKKINSM